MTDKLEGDFEVAVVQNSFRAQGICLDTSERAHVLADWSSCDFALGFVKRLTNNRTDYLKKHTFVKF
jgi:hypothetical protein